MHRTGAVQGDEEDMQATSGSIFSGIFGAKKSASLATVAEKNISGVLLCCLSSSPRVPLCAYSTEAS